MWRIAFCLERALNVLHLEAFDHVALAHVLIALERHAAFLTAHHFFDFVLEALERGQLALVNDDIVPDQANMRTTFDLTFGHAAARHLANLGDVEHLQDFGIAEEGDINEDCFVNLSDFADLAANWLAEK